MRATHPSAFPPVWPVRLRRATKFLVVLPHSGPLSRMYGSGPHEPDLKAQPARVSEKLGR